MGKLFSRSVFAAAIIGVLVCGEFTVLAQSGRVAGGAATNGVSGPQLSTALDALQQLLQSGVLNPEQTQRATALLTAVEGALAGGTLNAAELQQLGQAIVAARKMQLGNGQLIGQNGGLLGNPANAQRLTAGIAAIQQLLQSGILDPAQTQRATDLLAAVQNALAGGKLTGAETGQLGAAIAAARKIGQSTGSTSPLATNNLTGSSTRSLANFRSNLSAASAARQGATSPQRSGILSARTR